jgi:hypothetical protein
MRNAITKLTPSAKRVLLHMVKFGSITNAEANAILKCRSVSRRITEIDRGTSLYIDKQMKKDSDGQKYVRYSLSEYERSWARTYYGVQA